MLYLGSTALKGLTILSGSVPIEHGHGLHAESTDTPHERLHLALLWIIFTYIVLSFAPEQTRYARLPWHLKG